MKQKDDYLWKGILEDVFDDFLRFLHSDADRVFDLSRASRSSTRNWSSYSLQKMTSLLPKWLTSWHRCTPMTARRNGF